MQNRKEKIKIFFSYKWGERGFKSNFTTWETEYNIVKSQDY